MNGQPDAARDSNAKGDLIAACRTLGLPDPGFVNEADGPGHAPSFRTTVLVGERVLGRGAGRSKRDAERAASLEALGVLQGERHDRRAPAAAVPPATGPAANVPAATVPAVTAPAAASVTRWPVYADVLSQALLVAHERNEDGPLADVARDAAALYCQLLAALGHAPDPQETP
ncbi:putative dsRNA-binding protein [Deinococcus aquiradiocola]|uniref:DRBM domain-containing protein n=1 Tax=Deinococcus aquiradiocola TaxID=393059 RepID=A0A917UTL3_9DEIO|nr:putative dsRNA-binding protein [Deinococcus aquiradiocola]GGJ84178.1 hypothetical protein GCM10008939_30070 [Deinococcus aquiradiocola]